MSETAGIRDEVRQMRTSAAVEHGAEVTVSIKRTDERTGPTLVFQRK